MLTKQELIDLIEKKVLLQYRLRLSSNKVAIDNKN